MKLALRKIANAVARHAPKPLVRYWLKSCWYQPELQDALQYHVQPYRYDSAIPTRFDLNLEALRKPRPLPGFQLNAGSGIKLVNHFTPFAAEINGYPKEEQAGCEFWFRNHAYQDLDAVTLYCMVRHFKPRRIIEAGCGFSSRIISMAARQNVSEGRPVECTFIDPYPSPRILRDRLAGPLLEKKIQDVPLSVFQALQPGDFLFIDTSHVIKTQNDCCYEYLQVIPALKPGVLIHVHDIFTPYDYPEDWILNKLFAFNEQYALECLMSGNPNLEVILPVHYLWTDHRDSLSRLFPDALIPPVAFWLKTKNGI